MEYKHLLVIYCCMITVMGQPYPFHIDILTDHNDEQRITKIVSDFFNSSRTVAWESYNIKPVSFTVHVNSTTPGIDNYYPTDTSSTIYIDLMKYPSDILCILSKSLGVPYIQTSVQLTNNCQPTKIRPSATEYIDVAHQIFEYRNRHYTEVIFIHEFIHGLDLRIFQRQPNTTLRLMQFRVRNGTVPRNVKQFVQDGNAQSFILFVSYDVIKSILQTFRNYTSTKMDKWIVIPTDGLDCPVDINMTFTMVCVRHDVKQFNLTSNYTVTLGDALLQKSLGLIDKAVFTFPAVTPPSALSLRETLSRHIKSIFDASDVDEEIMHIEMLNIGDKVSRVKHGYWTRPTKVVIDKQPFGLSPPYQMRVVLIHEPPFIEKFVNASGIFFRGYTIDVLDKITSRLNIEYTAFEVKDSQYGIALEDGSWNGIIGTVMRGEADIGVGPISVTAEREEVIDFTAPYYDYAGLQILTSGPVASRSMFGFVAVFDSLVWLVWFGFLSLTSLLLYLFHMLMFKFFSTKHEKNGDNVFTITDTIWFVIASVTITGPDKHPGTFAGRLLVIGFWFFCQIMMATYTANMAAFMTSRRLTTGITSLHDLASQNAIKYSSLSGSVMEVYFKRMKEIEDNFFDIWKNLTHHTDDITPLTVWDYPLDDLYTRIYRHMNKTGFLTTSSEGISRVLDGGFAFITETPMIKYERTRTCNLVTVGEVFSAKPYALVLPQNSQLKDQFDAQILELQAEAYFEERKEVWWSEQVTCPKEDDTTAGLPFENLAGIFILTGIGFGVGVFILGIEVIVHRLQKEKQNVQDVSNQKVSFGSLKKSYIFRSFTYIFNRTYRNNEKMKSSIKIAVAEKDSMSVSKE